MNDAVEVCAICDIAGCYHIRERKARAAAPVVAVKGQDTAPADPLADERVRKLVEAAKGWLDLATHCSIEEGVCCCGDSMQNHSNPMDCGHSPVDHGSYIAMRLEKRTRAAIAAIEAQPPMSRPHMGQIMAECDCSRMAECEAAQRCLAEAEARP